MVEVEAREAEPEEAEAEEVEAKEAEADELPCVWWWCEWGWRTEGKMRGSVVGCWLCWRSSVSWESLIGVRWKGYQRMGYLI